MIYDVCFELADGRSFGNSYITRAEDPAEVEDEIACGDDYVVSNSKKTHSCQACQHKHSDHRT